MNFIRLNYSHKKRVPNQTEPYPTSKELEELYLSQNNICALCNEIMIRTPDLDHIVPIAHGGLHILQNIRFTHYFCNRERPRYKRPVYTVLRISEDTGEHTTVVPW